MNGTGNTKTKALSKSKQNADKDFSKDKKAGSAFGECAADKVRWLKVEWDRPDAYCGDKACLIGTAQGIEKTVEATGHVSVEDQGTVAGPKGKGQNSFKLDWKVCDVVFKGKKAPDKLPATGKLFADGLSATTPKALAVKRLPDKALEAVSIHCSSPKKVNGTNDYSWTAAFRAGVENTTIKIRQTLQIKKAWLGKRVAFDAKTDKLKQAWGYVKKSGTTWKFWDTTANAWAKLPRKMSSYTLNSIIFVESGTNFVSRDDGGKFTWPESFSEPKNYESKKKAWLKNIHDVWDNKFILRQKDCKGTAPGLCQWDIDIRVNWSDGAGDKLVYAVWSADWERSNARDW